MRAVFATETLAAGINMPARTTVICSMAKRSDLGMELLETSNMLQMVSSLCVALEASRAYPKIKRLSSTTSRLVS